MNESVNSSIRRLTEDLDRMLIENQFRKENIESNDSRTLIVYKYRSRSAKGLVSVHLAVIPLLFVIRCMAYVPTVRSVNTTDRIVIDFNWLRETSKRIFTRLKTEFVPKLIEILSFGLNDMPIEVIQRIIKRLSFGSIVQLSMTNKYWKEICEQNDLWRKLFRNRFSINSYNRFAIQLSTDCLRRWSSVTHQV